VSPSRADVELNQIAADFERLRPRLTAIADRILGRNGEADDIVQEAWIRWQRCDRDQVISSTALLVTTTTRLALNTASSARARYELPVSVWTREPADPRPGPTDALDRDETIDVSVELLLQRLAPAERAAFVLRRGFDYAYPDIARAMRVTEANARQLVCRAHRRLRQDRRRPLTSQEHRDLVAALKLAARDGDLASLERTLLPARPVRRSTSPRSFPETERHSARSATWIGSRPARAASDGALGVS
jgi:RNA polymerase sigma-70 factor (ECF subfamily)